MTAFQPVRLYSNPAVLNELASYSAVPRGAEPYITLPDIGQLNNAIDQAVFSR